MSIARRQWKYSNPLAATDKTPGNKFIDKWQELGLDADYMASRHLKQPQTLWSTFKLELYRMQQAVTSCLTYKARRALWSILTTNPS